FFSACWRFCCSKKKAERERAAVPQDFRAMAAKREAKASGWSDRGEQWKAAPQGLRTLIDGYNAAPKEMRPAILDRILSDGQRREQVRELMAEQRSSTAPTIAAWSGKNNPCVTPNGCYNVTTDKGEAA
ncbi:hypothetical protein L3V16_22890, partial [Brucella ciceri]|uniref:hypothetical protein n=1 Tax=Brucella ciceri TaxID=391287 RepID=UPI001F13FF48